MKKMKFLSTFALVGLLGLGTLAACSNSSSKSASDTISVVSREDGSGTRGAFVELFGVQKKGSDGKKVDLTSSKAIVTNSTSVMLTTVSGDKAAVGYSSLGSLNSSVKAVSIDGVKPSCAAVKDKSYKSSRPFNIVTKPNVNAATQDFMHFILSSDGQAVISKDGYIPLDNTTAYQSSVDSGKVVISGSSSVTPVMEKLKEAYQKINAKVQVEIQQSDSSTGITDAISGTSDIGMASRELADNEKSQGVSSTVIATDGIAVIVNKNNSIDNLTSEQVKKIFTGDVTTWSNLSK